MPGIFLGLKLISGLCIFWGLQYEAPSDPPVMYTSNIPRYWSRIGNKPQFPPIRFVFVEVCKSVSSLSLQVLSSMRTFVVFLCILVVLLAIAFNRVYQRLFNVALPDDFPINSTWQFKIVGFSFGLAKDLVSLLLNG